MPSVSVIIPVYNVEKYLAECLDSVINQTLSDIEIICVNDASPDGSEAILQEYTKRDSRIKIITHNANQGLGAARNSGVEAATAPYLMFIDSDDYVAADMLEKMFDAIVTKKAQLAWCGITLFNEDGVLIRQNTIPEKEWPIEEALNCKLLYPGIIMLCNKIFHRELFKDIKQLKIISEDLPALAEYLVKCKKIVTLNKPFYHYRKRKGTISNPAAFRPEQWDDFFYANELFLSTLRNTYGIGVLKMLTVLHSSSILWRINEHKMLASNTWLAQQKKIRWYLKKDVLDLKQSNIIMYFHLIFVFSIRLPLKLKEYFINILLELSLKVWSIQGKSMAYPKVIFLTLKSSFKGIVKKVFDSIEITVVALFAFFFRMLSNPVWLIGERPQTAQENGMYFFNYLQNSRSEIKAYYIIDRKSSDINNLEKRRTTQYNSLYHKILFCSSTYYISSHYNHCVPKTFGGKKRYPFSKSIINVFLQHGITCADVSPYYGKENSGISLFICGAKPEYEFVRKNFGYQAKEVAFTGFARFDGLHNFTIKKQILLMPTWRRDIWVQNSSEYFLASEYYLKFQNLLNNPSLHQLLDRFGFEILFFPHYEIQNYLELFNTTSKNIQIAGKSEQLVQELLKQSCLLITDTSSVHFDFAYMQKPVIYYQFDKKSYSDKHLKKGYFDFEKMGFGEVLEEEEELIKLIEEYLKNNCVMPEKYKGRMKTFFPFYDNKNCERIFQEIVKLS